MTSVDQASREGRRKALTSVIVLVALTLKHVTVIHGVEAGPAAECFACASSADMNIIDHCKQLAHAEEDALVVFTQSCPLCTKEDGIKMCNLLVGQTNDDGVMQRDVNDDDDNDDDYQMFKRRSPFLGKRRSPFLGKRRSPFLGKRRSPFLGKRRSPFLGKRRSPFLGKRRSPFLGKRVSDYLEEPNKRRSPFLGKRRSPFLGKRSSEFPEELDKRRSPFLGKR